MKKEQSIQQISGQQIQMFAIDFKSDQVSQNKKGKMTAAISTANNMNGDQEGAYRTLNSKRERNPSGNQSLFQFKDVAKTSQDDSNKAAQFNKKYSNPQAKMNQSYSRNLADSSITSQQLPMMPLGIQNNSWKMKQVDPKAKRSLATLNVVSQNQIMAGKSGNARQNAPSGPYQMKQTTVTDHYGTLGSQISQRSQSVADNLNKKPKWKFQQNQVDPLFNQQARLALHQKMNASNLEIRGNNGQGKTQPLVQFAKIQSKKSRQRIGLVINPGFRTESSLNNKLNTQVMMSSDSHLPVARDDALDRMVNDSQSRNKLKISKHMVNNALADHNNNYIMNEAYTNNHKSQLNQINSSQQRTAINSREEMMRKTSVDILPKTTAQASEQFRSKSTLSVTFRNKNQNKFATGTHYSHNSNYRKGEMINDALFDSQNGKKKDGNSSFNFDRHLSKQGTTNLQRYYKLKETIQAKSQRLQNFTPQAGYPFDQANDSQIYLVKNKAGMISIEDQRKQKLHGDNINQTIKANKLIPIKKHTLNNFNPKIYHDQISSRGAEDHIFNLKTNESGQFHKSKKEKTIHKKQDVLKKEKKESRRFEPIQVGQLGNQQKNKITVSKRESTHSPKLINSEFNTKEAGYATNQSDDASDHKLLNKKRGKKSKSSKKLTKRSYEGSKSKIQGSKESIDVQLNTFQEEDHASTSDKFKHTGELKHFFRTEDGQLQQADSDDEYIMMQRQIQNINSQSRHSLNQSQQDPIKQFSSADPHQEYGFVDESQLTQLKLSHDFQAYQNRDSIKRVKKILTNLKHVHRYESQSKFQAQQVKEKGKSADPRRLAVKSLNIFKLATSMSKQVKHTNNSLNRVLNTLGSAMQISHNEIDENGLSISDLQNIGQIDTATLLNNTNVSIKNMNYSLMKLVTVQQEAQVISKGTVTNFQLIDRLPAVFEVNATALPHPAKIIILPDQKNSNNIKFESLKEIVGEYVQVYISTQTKNPNHRNHQVHLKPPIPKVYTFTPIGTPAQYTSQDGTMTLTRDQFDKIYIGFHYDLSNADVDSLKKHVEHLFKPGDKIDEQKVLDQIAQLNMQILVRFPKDKEEIQKKRMAALMKKLKDSQGDDGEELTGEQGEQKLKEINKQLTKYYQEQKTQMYLAEQQKQLKASQNRRRLSNSPESVSKQGDSGQVSIARLNSPSVKLNQSSKIKNELEKQIMSHTEQNFYERKPEAYNFLSEQATGMVRYNQLLDMYALQMNLKTSKQTQQNSIQNASDDNLAEDSDEEDFQSSIAHQYGMTDLNSKTQSDQLLGPIDHIARNAFVSSKYRQMHGIRQHLNADISATRMHNSIHKAQMNDLEKRLKSQKWLNKWDEFRVQKSIFVAKALAILKYRRRIKNIITIIVLSKFVKGIIQNYDLIKAFNMRKFTEFMIAIRMYVRFQKRLKGRYGEKFSHRIKNFIRFNTTFMVNSMKKENDQMAKGIVVRILQRKFEKKQISNKFECYFNKIKFVQFSVIEIKQIGLVKDHMAVMRILYSFMTLRHFFMSQPVKNKMAQRILTRLQQCHDHISKEIRSKKISDEKEEIPAESSMEENEELLQQLVVHIRLYDKINQMKYKLRIMENVQHQYALLLKYLEEEKEQNQAPTESSNFDTVRNCMIDTFQRQKEMAKVVTSYEEELYGVEIDQLNQSPAIGKKEKKNEPKEYDLKLSYKYLNQILLETDEEMFDQLHYVSTQQKFLEQDDLYDQMVIDDVNEDRQQAIADKKSTKKKNKEKSENTIADILQNEDHQQKLKSDRKNTIKLIQYYNIRPENKILHGNVNRTQIQKIQCFEKAYKTLGGTRARRVFDKERIFILNEDDRDQYQFFDKFKDEVIDKGHDYIGVFQRQYKRADLFKIIFKVLRMHESMSIQEKDRKDKGKDGLEETRNSKKKSQNEM